MIYVVHWNDYLTVIRCVCNSMHMSDIIGFRCNMLQWLIQQPQW